MPHPLVTIGLPVYNGAAYLDEALRSLCAQDFPDLDILISDNASTDDTPAIIDRWAKADKRIRAVRQNDNIGAIANFAFVLDNATTPWFIFGAHDDRWSPNYVSSLYAAVTQRPGLICAFPTVSQFEENGAAIPEKRKKPRFIDAVTVERKRLRHLSVILRQAKSGWYYGLYDTNALCAAKQREAAYGYVWAHDFIMLLPFLLQGKMTGAPSAVYYQRITTASEERYKPKTARAKCAHLCAFLKQAFAIWRDTAMPMNEKILTIPLVFDYSRRRLNWRMATFFVRPMQALLETLKPRSITQ